MLHQVQSMATAIQSFVCWRGVAVAHVSEGVGDGVVGEFESRCYLLLTASRREEWVSVFFSFRFCGLAHRGFGICL